MNKDFIYIIAFFLFGCRVSEPNEPNWYNLEDSPSFLDNDLVNKNNSDNIIYKPKKEFIFEFQYFDSAGVQLFPGIKFDEKCVEDHTVNCVKWVNYFEYKSLKSNHIIDFYKMSVYDSNGHMSMADHQTIIKYEYFNKQFGKILFSNQTGLIEDSTQVFLHPPRGYSFSILELNPFPMIKLPPVIGKEWESEIYIPNKMLTKISNEFGRDDMSLSTVYEIIEKRIVNSSFGEIQVYQIDAKNTGNDFETYLTAYYSEEYGFVELDYINYDKSKLFIKLVSTKE